MIMDNNQTDHPPTPLVISAIWWALILAASLSVLLDSGMKMPLE
jgi:hypothetical protein